MFDNMFLFLFFFSKKNPIILAPALPLWNSSLEQSDLRTCLRGYSPQWGHQIKHNLQLLGGAFFFSLHFHSQPIATSIEGHILNQDKFLLNIYDCVFNYMVFF